MNKFELERRTKLFAYWLELCDEAGLGDAALPSSLSQESRELPAIFTSIGRSIKANAARA